jgi:hypothetical protein
MKKKTVANWMPFTSSAQGDDAFRRANDMKQVTLMVVRALGRVGLQDVLHDVQDCLSFHKFLHLLPIVVQWDVG